MAKKLNVVLQRTDWKCIYTNSSNLIPRKLSEFKYKILLNFLSCGDKLSKWNNNISQYCDVCGEYESMEHLLYSCYRVRNIWQKLGSEMKFDLKLKHIILGFWLNSKGMFVRNLIIVIIAYSVHSSWSKCKFENKNFKDVNILS